MRKGPFARQLGEDTTKDGGDVLKLDLLGPFQKALQFLLGGHVCEVNIFPARHG